MTKSLYFDAAQYCNWSRTVFQQMVDGGLSGVHVTVAYHENFRETVNRIVDWTWRFRHHKDLIFLGNSAGDLQLARETGRTAIFLGLQNCLSVEADIGLLDVLHRLGIRFMQLSYNNQSLLCSGWMEPQDSGLTNMGRKAVEEMNRLGMVIDMSHSGERSTLEAIDLSARPVAVTHANPSSWHDTKRNKSDLVLKRLAGRKGMIGLSLYPFHMAQGSDTTIDQFCNMAARLADMIGVDRIGIGSDLCQDQSGEVLRWMREGDWQPRTDPGEASLKFPRQPSFFRTNLDFGGLGDGLRKTGFSGTEVDGILGGNWANFIADAFMPTAGQPQQAAERSIA